ncbi:MAG TPA: hypothetical protein VNZ22_11375, partial [Bacillota bacterium]|nr:hypothetical protein [Bacillota bacterium]
MRKDLGLGLLLVIILIVLVLAWRYPSSRSEANSEPASSRSQTAPPTARPPAFRAASRPETLPHNTLSDFHPLLASLAAETDPDRCREALEQAAGSVADADLGPTLDALVANPSPAAAELRQALVRRWAESDPAAAAAWTTHLPEGAAYSEALEQVAIAWA